MYKNEIFSIIYELFGQTIQESSLVINVLKVKQEFWYLGNIIDSVNIASKQNVR